MPSSSLAPRRPMRLGFAVKVTAREGLKSELLNEQRSRFFGAYMTKARERLKTTIDQATVRRVIG